MWVSIAPLQCTIECRCGRMHTRHAPLTLMAKTRFSQHFSQSYWWMITKLGMWVGIAILLNLIYWCSGRTHRRHAPLTLVDKNARITGFSPEFLSRHNDFFTSYFPIYLSLSPSGRHLQFPHVFWQSSWWIITKLGMWVGIATLLNPIYSRSGRMHRRHAPLTLMAKN